MILFLEPNEKIGGGVKVTYNDEIFFVRNRTCKEIVKMLCAMYGSTYKGRKDNICKVLNIVQKPPIMVTDDRGILLFPVDTHQREYCWINYFRVASVKRDCVGHTRITFMNNTEIILHTEYRSIDRQMRRCHHYVEYLQQMDEKAYLLAMSTSR